MIKRKRKFVMPKQSNLVRHLFEKDASYLGTGQAAILDLQDQLRGPLGVGKFEYIHRICRLSVVVRCH